MMFDEDGDSRLVAGLPGRVTEFRSQGMAIAPIPTGAIIFRNGLPTGSRGVDRAA